MCYIICQRDQSFVMQYFDNYVNASNAFFFSFFVSVVYFAC